MDKNPQAQQMAHESMVRNLVAQAEAIWPQERDLFARYGLPEDARILDVGCGIGESVRRLAELFPRAQVLGVDLHVPHLELARRRSAGFGDRVAFREGDAFELALDDASFDLVLCRHMLQAVPHPERVLAEMKRVARAGGWLHVVAEDYAMIHFDAPEGDVERFFLDGPCEYARRTGTDLLNGRKAPRLLRELGLTDVRMDYAVLDTERVPRDVLAEIFRAWRDGYSDSIASETSLSLDAVHDAFDAMLRCLASDRYAVWHLPIVSGRKA